MSDLIDRQQAIEAICMETCGVSLRNERCMVHCTEVQTVEKLPPAQPERIKGHWIEIALSNHTYKCSVCGRLLVNITDGKNIVAKNYPYCHCGADMREVTE